MARHRAGEQRNALRQVDNVNPVAVAEDVRLHLGVPAVGLVAEMRSGLEQLLHGDDRGRHSLSPSGSASAEPNDRPYGSAPVCKLRLWDAGHLVEEAAAFKGLAGDATPRLTRENKTGTLSRLTRAAESSTGTKRVQLG